MLQCKHGLTGSNGEYRKQPTRKVLAVSSAQVALALGGAWMQRQAKLT